MGLKKKISVFFRRMRKARRLNEKSLEKKAIILNGLERNKITFNSSNTPKVSIIIPFYNQEIYTWNCLKHLNNHLSDKISFEVLLVDDNSSETYDFSLIDGIKLIKNETNLGFLKSVNKAIHNSKGEYIYLLNNDTEVQESFLDELFHVFDNFENVGAVGSMLLNYDHSLQEAGAVFLKDFNIHQIVRKRKPYFPEVNYIKKVDYCSGCSLLFKKHKDNNDINLFDEQFAPAYFEETDLCFDIKYNQNKEIYVNPFSKVIHFNGVTYNSKDDNSLEKSQKKEALFKVNKEKFYAKWSKQINAIQSPDVIERIHEKYYKSIVFFNDLIPEYDKDSGSNRLKELMILFVKKGFHVTLVSKEIFSENHYSRFYQKAGINVFYEYLKFDDYKHYVTKYCSKSDFVWIYGAYTFKRYFKDIKILLPNSKIIYDMVDIHHLRFERAMKLNPSDKKAKKEYIKFKNIELLASKESDFVITISDSEKEFMKSFCDEKKLITISNIHYPKLKLEDTLSFEEREGIIFIGSTHTPNIDAIYYLSNEIMPIVWKTNPDLKLNIIGNIKDLIKDINHQNILFHGFLPSVETLFKTNKLMVAPLRYGAGVKGKIGQAFEYYLPVVSSSIGAEGMHLKNNENALIEDSPEDFANAIISLYNSKEVWLKLQSNSEKSLYPFSRQKASEIISEYF